MKGKRMAETAWIVMRRLDIPDHGEVWKKVGSRPIYASSPEDALLVANAQSGPLYGGSYLVIDDDQAHRHTLQTRTEYVVV